MVSAVQNFIVEPIRHRRFDLAWYRLTQLLHERTNGAFDDAYMRFAPHGAAEGRTAGLASRCRPAEVSRVVERLRQDGYNILPKGLTAADIEAITDFAFTTPAFAGHMDKPRRPHPRRHSEGRAAVLRGGCTISSACRRSSG